MHFSIPTIFVAGLAAGQAAATGWRLDAHQYSSPYNTNNECSTEQKPGYNWDTLEPGSFDSYGTNKFSGFKCGNSFGKRDGVTKRSFQDKCITADIDKEPKIECNGKDKMTIDSYQVSSSWDTDVDAHHEMPDGSVCKQTHRCTKGGNTVQNTQCAGSTKVTFKPKKGESGKNEKGESCSIGIHSIDFKCGEASSSSTQPAYSVPATSSAPAYSGSATESTSATGSSTSAVSSSETTSSVVVDTTSSTEGSPATTGVPTIPAYSSYANVSTTYSATSAVTAPSSYETTSLSSTDVSPEGTAPSYESSSTTANNSSAPVYSATTSSDVEVPTQTYEAPNTPDLLPQCINTWIGQSDCKDNADFSCYCRSSDLINNVMECIDAWSDDDDKTQSAAAYLQGICAPYVPENPAIITACPSGNKPPASPATQTAPVPEVPEETAPVYESSSTEGSPVTTAPVQMTTSTVYSTTLSTITSCAVDVEDCPAVSQTTAVVTETIAISTTVCPVSEAEGPKPTTEISPGLSSSVPVHSTTAIEEASTLTYYSTSAVTITSCAEDVTDCPASSTVVSSSKIPISYSVITTPSASSPASPEQTTISTTPSAPAPAPYTSSPSSPSGPAPTTVPVPNGPSTIITYSSSMQVPATYTTGESLGAPIPGSTTYATIDTTITVPQVQFVTSTISVPGSTSTISVGLAAGSPSEVPAYPTSTADSVGGIGGAASSSGFGTSYVPGSTGSPVESYEGGADGLRSGAIGLVVAAVAALFFVL
jgi:hypothetical protein